MLRRLREYSTGMKRRLVIGKMLLFDPELLFLDEPHNTLDQAAIALSVVANIATKPGQMLPIYDFCRHIAGKRIEIQRERNREILQHGQLVEEYHAEIDDAELLELGIADPKKIQVTRLDCP